MRILSEGRASGGLRPVSDTPGLRRQRRDRTESVAAAHQQRPLGGGLGANLRRAAIERESILA